MAIETTSYQQEVKKMADDRMYEGNPFMWILGFVLIFWVIGGWGIGGRGVATAEAVAGNTVGQRDLLDTMFAGFGGLKDQMTQQTFLLNGQINGLSKQMDDNEFRSLERENANLRESLQTATILNSVNQRFCEVFTALGQKPNTPPFLIDGRFAGTNNCGCCC